MLVRNFIQCQYSVLEILEEQGQNCVLLRYSIGQMDEHTKTIHHQLCLSLALRHEDMDERHFTVKEQKICTEYW